MEQTCETLTVLESVMFRSHLPLSDVAIKLEEGFSFRRTSCQKAEDLDDPGDARSLPGSHILFLLKATVLAL
jgi:hypothetical protein